jgi:putative membrane protein
VTHIAAPREEEQHSEPHADQPNPTTVSTQSQRAGRTRISAAWVSVMAGAVVLVLLLVFILQNTKSVKVSYLGLVGSMPLGIALLLAAIAGLLLAGGVASLRIGQLRHRLTTQTKSTTHGSLSTSHLGPQGGEPEPAT